MLEFCHPSGGPSTYTRGGVSHSVRQGTTERSHARAETARGRGEGTKGGGEKATETRGTNAEGEGNQRK